MTERYSPTEQKVIKGFMFDCIELRDGKDGLSITLIDENGSKLLVFFENFLAYRRLDEGDAIKIMAEIKPSFEKSKIFYVVEGSKFVAWFNEQSCNIHEGNHYRTMPL